MNLHAPRTIALLRFLRAHPIQQHRRIPPPLSTEAIAREYLNAIEPVCQRARKAFTEVEPELLHDLKTQRWRQGIFDQEKQSRPSLDPTHAQQLLAKAVAKFSRLWRPDELQQIAQRFGDRTDKHQRDQFSRQLQAALGIPYGAIERPIRDLVPEWTHENVRLIKTVPDRYFDRLADDVQDAYASGMHPDTLARQFRDRHEMQLHDAKRIARTEISKLNGRLNRERQQSVGASQYIWRCVHDNRVRDCHGDLDGQTCDWNDPPEGGGTDEGEPGHPGDGINCRCYAEPVLEGLV